MATRIVIEVEQLDATCFVIMPFSPTFQSMYERVVRPGIEAAGLTPVRGDEIFSKAKITDDIWRQVRSCRMVFAELSGQNSNVLYELGLAHAIGKPSIISAREEKDVPFDLRALRCLFYDINDPFWGDSLKLQISRMIRSAIEQVESPSVFSHVSVEGAASAIPPARPRLVAESRVHDVSGNWQGHVLYDDWGTDTSWNVVLHQVDRALSGVLVASTTMGRGITVVQEPVSGEIDGDHVRFHGVAYTFLERGHVDYWTLDKFEGQIVTPSQIEGAALDDEGRRAALVLRRVAEQ